jgi:hypothetical protein
MGVPDGHFAISYGDILEDMRQRSSVYDVQSLARGYSPLSAGYENFMIDVCLYYFRRREYAQAEQWQERLRTYARQNMHDPDRFRKFSLPLDEFADEELADSFTRAPIAVLQISAALDGSFMTGLLAGDNELFESQFEYAKVAHKYYMQAQLKQSAVNLEDARTAQLSPDFRIVAGQYFFQFVGSLSRDDAEIVYLRAPNDLRLWAYDALREAYKANIDEDAKKSGRTFDIIFPPPEGLEEHRAMVNVLLEKRQGPNVRLEQQ